MLKTNSLCPPTETCKEKSWEYEQYYLGERDKENRRCGEGQNHWSGAQSLECYTGHFFCDTMHGVGEYRCRHLGPENVSFTYEGQFYCNRMHGYGAMSYPDGRTFTGLFFNDVRWGPGIQFHAAAHGDVGLWRGSQLVRLAWKPACNSIVPEFMSTTTGQRIVESHRITLNSKIKTIGDTNTALEKWSILYPKYCRDLASPLCDVESFDQAYYRGKIYTLEEVDVREHDVHIRENSINNVCCYYAWNNNGTIIKMMKHSYKHESQRTATQIDLKSILSGPRNKFKPAGNHEIDCRTLLMAAYLGYTGDVAQLVNEKNVHPDISDIQGNSTIVYATCGDQPDAIHFLVEAGANINSFNDCCCTPLAIALMRYVCTLNDISQNGMLQALLPSPLVPSPPTVEPVILEWNITRQLQPNTANTLTKSPSKTNKNMSSKKVKSSLSIKDQTTTKRKSGPARPIDLEPNNGPDDSITENKSFYNNIHHEFSIKVTDTFTLPNGPYLVPYIFNVTNMVNEIEAFEEEQNKPSDKGIKKIVSNTVKDKIKTSKEAVFQNNEIEETSISSADKNKANMLKKIMCTVIQLLSDGANPSLVRCPQPALLMAVMSNSPNLIRHLVSYGADINETYHHTFNYSPLDVAVSRLLTHDNLEVVKALLECGADVKHRLVHKQGLYDSKIDEIQIPGPTLLHAVLAKKAENEIEQDIHHQLMELLLDHGCSPTIFYKGRSAIDVAMNTNIRILEVFIKNSQTNLNAIINYSNQTILVKMFTLPFFKSIPSSEKLQLFTNLLLYGADPLIKCQNCEDTYQNIFVFTRKILRDLGSSHSKPASPPGIHGAKPIKALEKPKKGEKLSTKSMGKMIVDDVDDYRQTVDLVTDCARLFYIRRLQAELMKELIRTINKYKHRHWNVILKECRDIRSIGLWLNPQRCLEIWDVLSDTGKKMYNDQCVHRHLLCIVNFTTWQNYGCLNNNVLPGTTLTASVKDAIDAYVSSLLRQHKVDQRILSMTDRKGIKPELDKNVKKYDVCFECILPLNKEKILCDWCKQISFCSDDCIKSNVLRTSCHPCSEYLKIKYFPGPGESIQ